MVWQKILWKGDGEDRDGWKVRETTARAAAANWRYAHLQMLKGIGKGVDRGPKTKHMTKITLNMKVKSLIGVVSFRQSLRFHIGFLMRSARMFVCFLDLYHAPKLFTSSSASSRTEGASQEIHAPPKEKQMPLLSSCGSREPSKYFSKDKILSFFSWLIRMFFTPIFRPRVQNWISFILIPSFTRSNSEEPWNLQTNTELSKRLLLQPNARLRMMAAKDVCDNRFSFHSKSELMNEQCARRQRSWVQEVRYIGTTVFTLKMTWRNFDI